jgi:hypothetical protein
VTKFVSDAAPDIDPERFAAVGAEVLDVRADQLGDARPGEDERGDQRGRAHRLRSGVAVGGV